MDARLRMISLSLVGVGWTLSALLLFWTIAPRAIPGLHLADGFCPGCTPAVSGPTGWQLGFPLAAWALVYFALTGFLIAHAGRAARVAAWVMSATATGASLVLTTEILLNSFSDCLPCLGVHIINAALFLVLSITAGRERSEASDAVPRRWPMHWRLGLAAVLIIAGGAAATASSAPRRTHLLAVRTFWAQTPQPIPLDTDDPTRGAADGSIVLVVFSSFQCPGCQAFANVLELLDRRFAGALITVFKHFPLGKECNAALAFDLQPRSCAIAEAAQAAHRLRAFWPYHDGLFRGSLGASEEDLQRIATDAGLALEAWKMETSQPAVREKIHQDIELAWRLGVDETPAVFLNGRRVLNLSVANLEALIAGKLTMRGATPR